MCNWKITMKQLRVQINVNKLQVRMILRAKKILQSHLKRNKRHGVVMFVRMNTVNYSALRPLNACAQNKKRPSVI